MSQQRIPVTVPTTAILATVRNHGRTPVQPDPDWFKTAVFYEVLLRAFTDSDGDGTGDLRGLIDHLDYLAWLGVDCLWLPPFYPSPMRDGGYDVSDYTSISSQYGTVDDFTELMDAAHERGMRVIIDLVMNHTSDAHPWFQASRSDPTGPYGDFYVWTDDNTEYSDARIIFVDTEVSNWTFDPVRRQYFWHRFFSHQPDLNFENPDVHRALFDVVRHWCRVGVDGFRLDAIPWGPLWVAQASNPERQVGKLAMPFSQVPAPGVGRPLPQALPTGPAAPACMQIRRSTPRLRG